MKKSIIVLIAALLLSAASKAQVVSNKDWVTVTSSLATPPTDSTNNFASAVDLVNNYVYVCGHTSQSKNAPTDYILIKYDYNGNVIWTKTYDQASKHDKAYAVCVDASGNVYVTGESQNSSNNYDIVTVKYNSSGTQQWAAVYNGSANTADKGNSIAVDASGNVYVCGYATETSQGRNFIVIKYDSSGNFIHKLSVNGSKTSSADEAIKLTLSGNSLYVVGQIQNNTSNYDVYTECYSISGTSLTVSWTYTATGSASNSDDCGMDIMKDGLTDALLICGYVQNTGTNKDYYVARLSASTGSLSFSSIYDAYGGVDRGASIIVDGKGNYALTGSVYNGSTHEYHTQMYDTSGTLKWTHKHFINANYGSLYPSISCDTIAQHFYVCGTTSLTTLDATVYQLTPTGNRTWIEYHNGNANKRDVYTDIVLDGLGRVYLTGISEYTLTGYYDITTARYSQTPYYWPPDINEELAPDAFAYFDNKGQLIDTAGNVVNDVAYYNTQVKPAVFIKKDKSMFFQFYHKDPSGNNDSIYRINLDFPEKNPYTNTYGFDTAAHFYNFLLPHCGANGITGVRGYKRLGIPNFIDGIDLHYYSNNMGMKYYFVVKPGYDPNMIIWHFTGATSSTITGTEQLNVNCPMGKISYEAPNYYQAVYLGGTSYTLIPKGTGTWTSTTTDVYRFASPGYTTTLPLVIEVKVAPAFDPQHAGLPDWQQTLAPNGTGGNEEGMAVCNDINGSSFFTGWANPGIMPVGKNPGYNQGTGLGGKDIYIAKFGTPYGVISGSMPKADRHEWTTIIGGSNDDMPYGISAIGDTVTGKIYVTGQTFSSDFHLIQNNSEYYQTAYHGNGDAFLFSVDNSKGGANITNQWSTYFGGSGNDAGRGIKADTATGNIYMVGITTSNAYSSNNCSGSTDGGFPNCDLGGSSIHNNHEGGKDGFIAKFNASGVLQHTSFIGGDGDDELRALAVKNGTLYLAGFSDDENNLPLYTGGSYDQTTVAGTNDGYILKLSTGIVPQWGTLFGGSGNDEIRSLDIDVSDRLIIGGYTETSTSGNNTCAVPSNNGFPLCNPGGGAVYYNTYSGGSHDGFFAAFNSGNALIWSTYYGTTFGDAINGISCGKSGNLYFGGTADFVDQSWDPQGYQRIINFTTTAANNAFYSNITNTRTGLTGFLNSSFESRYSTLISKNVTQSANGVSSWEEPATNGKYFYMTGATEIFPASSSTFKFYPHAGNFSMGGPACCPNAYNTGYDFKGGTTDAYVLRYNTANMFMNVNEISSNKQNNTFFAYPNPSQYAVFIKSAMDLEKVNIEIYDMQGRLLHSKLLNKMLADEPQSLDFDSYSPGMYLLMVKSKTFNASYKLIKQ